MSKRLTYSILTLVVLILTTFLSHSTLPAQSATQHAAVAITEDTLYTVNRVVDGDTIVVNVNGSKLTVRLIGIDTPEVVDPRKPVQCFGTEASAETKSLLTNQSVTLKTDPTQSTYDKYGRLLAYVWRADGLFVNKTLIDEGYAHEYTYDVPYQYQTEFKAAEKTAREAQKGLWAPGACS